MKRIFNGLFFLCVALTAKSQAGDCPGLCITSGGTYAAIAGSTAELTAANRGCLTAGEASSSFWFQVCFTSSGTFQFYINPSGNRNDFDFAIWNGSTCPPTSSPIRCTWAAVPPGGPCPTCDYTGLGNGATDLSEGALGNGWVLPLAVTAGQCITININNYGSGSNNFTIDFTGTTAGLSCLTLPIELIHFKGVAKADHTLITWTTSSESNNSHFILEKSPDGLDWFPTHEVEGAGNSSSILNYEVKDFAQTGLTDYYRLKQVDFNGTVSYSGTIVVDPLTSSRVLIRRYNTLLQDVGDDYIGLYFELYDDGTVEKIWRR